MIDIKSYIEDELNRIIAEAGYELETPAVVSMTSGKQKEYGDLASNAALGLASKAKQNPRAIAERIVEMLKMDHDIVESVGVAGPGFINFNISPAYLCTALSSILAAGEAFGGSDPADGKKTQVEFVSANPTGPLTIGHGRQAVLGDTIARLLEATGHDVTREYYFNDAGRQMRVLGDSVRLRCLELLGEPIEFPEDYYQGEYIRDIAQQALDAEGERLKESEDIDYFRNLAEAVIFEDIKRTVGRLGITFDVFFNEKSLYENKQIDEVVAALREKDLIYDEDGAVWFRTTQFGQDQDRVIIKSTGEPTYRLPDIAYHRNKMERGFELVVDIFGADHVATYPDVLAGLEALGYDANRVKVLIHQFVTLMEGAEKIKMSTRKANFITLDELMDEVGEDVTRYFFIHRSMTSHLNFDLTLAKTESDENPVYYVQYAHARICSILRHAEKEGFQTDGDFDGSLLKAPEELDVIKTLLLYPDVVASAASEFEPHRVPAYLEEVATVYHRFQHAGKRDDGLRVVTKDEDLTKARLALCRATRTVLANGLTLLGISKPEQM